MIFSFARDTANLLQVDSCAGDSDNMIISMVVLGGAAIATAFHDMDSCNNHHDNMNNLDNDDNSLQATNRKQHGDVLFWSTRHQFNYGHAKKTIYYDYLWTDSLKLGLYFGCPNLGLKTW